MLHGLPSEAPWNQTHESVPEFPCSFPDCSEAAWRPEDMKLCEVCGKRYCADHIARMDDLYVCETCAKCVHCGGSAVLQCDLCSDFVCLNHQREFSGGIDPDTGYHGDAGVSCWPKCKPIMRAPAPVVELREVESVCPF